MNHDFDACPDCEDGEWVQLVGYGDDDEWYVLGESTQSATKVLAAMLLAVTEAPVGLA